MNKKMSFSFTHNYLIVTKVNSLFTSEMMKIKQRQFLAD